MSRPPRIVLTGAPGSGKTTIAHTIAALHADRFVIVPEAATQYYTALGKRWDQLDLVNRRDAQRGIYRLQVEQERRLAEANPGKALLLDRGTIDGSAYWPDGPEAYWKDLGSSAEAELARYDKVVVLQTCAHLGIYDGDASNRVRFESPEAAIENEELLMTLWAAHPNRIVVCAEPEMSKKLAAVEAVVFDAAMRHTNQERTEDGG